MESSPQRAVLAGLLWVVPLCFAFNHVFFRAQLSCAEGFRIPSGASLIYFDCREYGGKSSRVVPLCFALRQAGRVVKRIGKRSLYEGLYSWTHKYYIALVKTSYNV